MASPSAKRLLKESSDLHKNPSPYFTATPLSDTNLHDWHFTLVGPDAPSPYAEGLYHGRITFPATYPLRPPAFRFLTPSARFEVNREICLSISGHHEETWQPAWGVRTALLAIRSEIMVAEARGQVGGMEGSELLRKEYALASRSWRCRECGGRMNGEIMREWWAVCRERGVGVGELDRRVLGEERGEEVEVKKKKQGDEDKEEQEEANNQDGWASASATTQQQPPPPPPQPPLPAAASVPASSSPAPLSPPPAAPPPRSRPTSASSTSDGVWLDRAIVGVVVALVFLILRRILSLDE